MTLIQQRFDLDGKRGIRGSSVLLLSKAQESQQNGLLEGKVPSYC